MTAFYTDRLSVSPGETFALHMPPAPLRHARLEVARIGAGAGGGADPGSASASATIRRRTEADMYGCGWPAYAKIEVGADWRSGYYDLVLTDAAGEVWRHFVCVRAAPDRKQRRRSWC